MVWQGKKPSGIAGCILYKASQNSNSPEPKKKCAKFRVLVKSHLEVY